METELVHLTNKTPTPSIVAHPHTPIYTFHSLSLHQGAGGTGRRSSKGRWSRRRDDNLKGSCRSSGIWQIAVAMAQVGTAAVPMAGRRGEIADLGERERGEGRRGERGEHEIGRAHV